jgi:colicin import membrane protein
LTACAAEPIDLQSATAEQLQAEMLDITEAAAAGDFADAQSLLADMQANLRTATAARQVSAERSASIQSGINLVNADLTEEIEAAAQQAADAAALAEEQNAKEADADADPGDDNGAAESEKAIKEAAKEAAKQAREAREECRKDKDKSGECN